ncbi:MAG: glycoside hydrolase family 2 [Firmicutes bacterium]|nr:glycoside hydrolase family 2 [Bacillota bacterium]
MERLLTVQGEALLRSDAQPWPQYPRPQMVRDSFRNLNGWWDFAITSDERPPQRFERRIRVPFVPESALSGIEEAVPDGSFLWYRLRLEPPFGKDGERVLLHVGAADQTAVVWVDGRRAPLVHGTSDNGYTHQGGYEAFTAELTDLMPAEGSAELIIQVHDHLGTFEYPYGKQSLTRGGMWYTPCSGIWQTVWMETVPQAYIQAVHTKTVREADGAWRVMISAEGISEGQVVFGELTLPLTEGWAELFIRHPRLWRPEDPYLYEFAVQATSGDAVQSYFALRTLDTRTVDGVPRLCLNGKPYFFHGLLDQGYWPDGLWTPADPAQFEEEILKVKALGFNMLRKHIKVEPELFYYDCDRLGIAVFQDMVQNGDYDFKRDTILPTLAIHCRSDRKLHTDPSARKCFLEGMTATVQQLKEHPSIVCWTIFNEGWGQFCGTEAYMQLRHEDDTRWIDTASGWFHPHGLKTDVESCHNYFFKLRVHKTGRPFVLSECGGLAWRPDGHAFNPEYMYGYRKFKDRPSLAEAIVQMYEKKLIPLISKGLCAVVYTQVSDVEDETNGLFSYDRKLQKLLPEEFENVRRIVESINRS